jgi:hypothetical protein
MNLSSGGRLFLGSHSEDRKHFQGGWQQKPLTQSLKTQQNTHLQRERERERRMNDESLRSVYFYSSIVHNQWDLCSFGRVCMYLQFLDLFLYINAKQEE